jgi:hypothetical protein
MNDVAGPEDESESRRLLARVDALDQRLAKAERKRRDGWEKAQAIASMATPLLTFGLGLWLVSLANVGLERQKFRVSSVREMQALLGDLRDPALTQQKAETTAAALAAFGPAAITPLLNVIESRGPYSVLAGEAGLRAVGMSDRDIACERLQEVVATRSPLYAWTTQLSAIRLVGDLDCADAVDPLREYRHHVASRADEAGLAIYARTVRAEPEPTLESLDRLAAEVDRSLAILAGEGRP